MSKHIFEIPLINHNDGRPLHLLAEEQLRLLINQPEYQNGKLFPKETDLAKRWGISRNTLRHAISKLVNEGLLERKKRSGTKVAKKRIITNLGNWASFTHEMENQGTPFTTLLLQAESKIPANTITEALELNSDTPLICLQRLRSLDEQPMVYFESWFHPRIGLDLNDDFNRPLYELLNEKYHIIPFISQEEIRAISASEKLASLLNVNLGDPLLERIRKVLDAGRRPIEYNLCYYKSDSFTYRIEIKREI